MLIFRGQIRSEIFSGPPCQMIGKDTLPTIALVNKWYAPYRPKAIETSLEIDGQLLIKEKGVPEIECLFSGGSATLIFRVNGRDVLEALRENVGSIAVLRLKGV